MCFPKKWTDFITKIYNMDIYTVVQWGSNEKGGEMIEGRQGVVAQYNIRLEHNSTHRETGIRKNGLI